MKLVQQSVKLANCTKLKKLRLLPDNVSYSIIQ
jgi:hypothetical protein